MKSALLAGLLLLLAPVVEAQRFLNEVFPAVKKTAGITYGSNYTVLSGAPVFTGLQADVYEPDGIPDTMARRPLVVFLHGGSFLPPYLNTQLEGGRNDSGIVLICQSFAKRGYVVANIDYRLGWNPVAQDADIVKGTFITALVRGIQDVKAAVRFFRKDAATTNLYRIDAKRVIVMGMRDGAVLALNYAILQHQYQLSIPKFISDITDSAYGFEAGMPYVNSGIIGDLDGYGGDPAHNNPNNSAGYDGKANFICSYEGVVADINWVGSGLPPIVAFHRPNNNINMPYGHGHILRLNMFPWLGILDVSGPAVFMPMTASRGNNDCFGINSFTDPYTAKAMILSDGVEGLYPQGDTAAGISWFDSVSAVSECQAAGLTLPQCNMIWARSASLNSKPGSLLYLDTLMGYLNPRIVQCLYLAGPAPAGIHGTALAREVIRIFPNPASGQVSILASGEGIRAVTIKDMSGKLLRHVTGDHPQRMQIRLEGLPAGMYVITVATDRAIVSRKLFIE